MRIGVIADTDQRSIILQQSQPTLQPLFFQSPDEIPADVAALPLLDLQFDGSPSRLSAIASRSSGLIILNEVIQTIDDLKAEVVRINAWPLFFERPIVEAACNNPYLKEKAAEVFSQFGKKTAWVPDVPGLISARILAGIINEACYAAEENISSPGEIDIAMKLGVNYPMGPFEWAEKAGWQKIASLLQQLMRQNPRHSPCNFLLQKAGLK